MNVLMITPTAFFTSSGNSVRVLEEVRALQSLGVKITVCTYRCGDDPEGLDIRRICYSPKSLRPGRPTYHRLYLDALLLLSSLRLAMGQKPDILHVHLHEGALIGEICRKLTGIPVVFDAQGSLTRELSSSDFIKNDSWLFRLLRGVEGTIVKRADAILTSSQGLLNIMQEEFGVSAKHVFKVLDGVNTEKFKPGLHNRGDILHKLGIPASKKVVVYLGLLSYHQGIDMLLQAIPEVVAQHENIHFLLMGFPNEDKYRDYAETLGVAHCVTFTGQVDYQQQAAIYLSAGDIAITPKMNVTESNGKILNYMAMGLPTVAFDYPSNREFLGELGGYPREESPKGLAEAILKLLLDEDLAARLGPRLREKAVKEYSWTRTGHQIMEIYEETIAQQGKNKRGKKNV